MASTNLPRDSFGSKFGVVAASAGSAIGLGNIWRFPYVVGENGGGAFLLIYLAFIITIGLPVMLSEFTIGRKAQRNAFGSFRKLAPKSYWPLVGLMGIIAAFAILAFYSTIAGWTLEYIINSVSNSFAGNDPEVIFENFKSGTFRPILWQLIFMIMTAWIVFSGVKHGIERYTKILMPFLLLLIIIMCIRSLTLDGAAEGVEFLFRPDFSKISWPVILKALGQAAFSLSIGMGTLITYGSYINKKENLTKTAIQVSAADTIIAVLAGVMIFPAVFALGFQPDDGPGLVFVVLPGLFLEMPGGYVFSIIFFVLLAVAALTSTVSVLEVVVAYFSEELNISRKRATVIAASSIWVLGIFATLSFSDLSGFKILDKTIFDLLEYFAANMLLPLGAMLIVIFLGWHLGYKKTRLEITNEGLFKGRMFGVYFFIIKFIAPIAIALVFLYGIGLINF
ncbi:MAG: sodium-dependent transporter [Bacteroidales bacterium]|nr:sodium-dependent transporter [Bacteroidales bacterium]